MLRESFYPGWKAKVDGRSSPVAQANYAFRAVALEPGRHRVRFSLQPRLWQVAAALSIVSWLVVLLALLIGRSRGRDKGRCYNGGREGHGETD